MKKLLIFLGCVIIVASCRAQLTSMAAGNQPVTVNQPYIFSKWISVGKYTTSSMPLASACPRCILYNTDSSNFAFSNGSQWNYMGGAGGGSFVPHWGTIVGTITSQTDLMNLFGTKVNYSDTAAMLAAYSRSALVVKYQDTSNMLSAYLRVALGVKYTDTASMLSAYLRSAQFTKAGIGLGNVTNNAQVINAGNAVSIQVGPFASIPAASGGPTWWFASDTVAWYFNTGSSYVKAAGSGGGGGGGDDSTLMLSKHQATLLYVPLSAYTQHGIDSLIGFTPYNSTNPSGFISANQSITLQNGTGSDVAFSTSGSTLLQPVVTINANAVTYGKMQQNPSKTLIGNQNSSTGNNGAVYTGAGIIWNVDTLKADTTLLATITMLNTKANVDSGTWQTKYRSDTGRANVYAILGKSITLNQGRGVTVTGTPGQLLSGSPTWNVAADTTVISSLFALADSVAQLRLQDTVLLPGFGILSSVTGLIKTFKLDTIGATIHGLAFNDARYVKRTDSFHLNIIKSSPRGFNPLWGHDSTLVGKSMLDSGIAQMYLQPDSTLVTYVPPTPPTPLRNELQVNLTNNHVCEGNSITYGYGTTTPATQNYCALMWDTLGITNGSNRAVTNSTIDDALSRQFAGDPAGDVAWSYSLMIGENNFGEDTSAIKQNAIREGIRAAIANHFMDSVWSISNAAVTKTGTWTNLSAANLISKSLAKAIGNPMYSTTAGNTLTATVYDNNVVIGTYGWKNTSSYGSVSISIDGVTQVNPMTGNTVFSGSNMCTNFTSQIGTYDPRQPIVWIFSGLGIGAHTVVITLLQNLETDFDYIGKMVQPIKAEPMMIFHVTKRTPAGYFAYSAVGGGPAGIDSINRNIDSVSNFFRRIGLPLATVATNEWINNSVYYTDGLHFLPSGQILIADAALARINRGSGGQVTGDTATTTTIGLESTTDKIKLSHTIKFRKAYVNNSDSLAYAIGDTAFLRGVFPDYGLVKSPKDAADSFGYAVDTTAINYKSQTNALLALKAPLASPTFTGVPAVPTASPGTNTTQAASTAFVQAALPSLTGYAPLASPSFTGVPVAPTASPGMNTTQLATTAFTTTAVSNGVSGLAPLASPTFTGIPAVPTASPGTNTTQAASTAFVQAAIPSLSGYAPLASPAFTGVPTAPTASGGTNTTQIATTAFADAAAAAAQSGAITSIASTFTAGPQFSVFYNAGSTIGNLNPNTTTTPEFLFMQGTGSAGQTPLWSAISESYVTNLSTDLAAKAPLASPTFTGIPAVPTASPGTNTTQAASTAFVTGAISGLSGLSFTGWQGMTTSGTITGNYVSIQPSSIPNPFTLTLPASPVDGQFFEVDYDGGISQTASMNVILTGNGENILYNGTSVSTTGTISCVPGTRFMGRFNLNLGVWFVTKQ